MQEVDENSKMANEAFGEMKQTSPEAVIIEVEKNWNL